MDAEFTSSHASQIVLVLMDEPQIPLFEQGKPPIVVFSHDKNLLQFAHESIRQGHQVYFSPVQSEPSTRSNLKIESVYPVWQSSEWIQPGELDPNIVVSVFPNALNVRQWYPNAKIIAIIPALHWIEDPGNFTAEYQYDLLCAARYNIDYFVTQNERMKNILEFLLHFLVRSSFKDRIIVCPQGIVPELVRDRPNRASLRSEIGLTNNEVMIINSGGIWKWTDFCTFFEAYAEFSEENPKHRLRLFVMGVVQPLNHDHDEYVLEFRGILERFRDALAGKLILIEDWKEASELVGAYTSVADVGLNVNKDTLETWQSYRMRFLDYMYYGIPVINTRGDEMSATHPEGLYSVVAASKKSYKDVLQDLNSNPENIRLKSQGILETARLYDSRKTYGELIKNLVMLPRRAPNDHAQWPPSIVELVESRQTRRTDRVSLGKRLKELFRWK